MFPRSVIFAIVFIIREIDGWHYGLFPRPGADSMKLGAIPGSLTKENQMFGVRFCEVRPNAFRQSAWNVVLLASMLVFQTGQAFASGTTTTFSSHPVCVDGSTTTDSAAFS